MSACSASANSSSVSIDLSDVRQKVQNTAGVTPLVVVPGHKLNKVVVESDTSLAIDDGRVRVSIQVTGDEIVLGVCENALEFAFRSILQGLLDLIVSSRLLENAGKIDDGDVRGRNTHGHAGKLSIERWNNLADSLGCTSAAGNDVLGSSSATSPVLGRWAIDRLLGSGVRVDGGHEAFLHAESVVDDLGERCKAVGCAGGIGDDWNVGLVFLVVDTHDEHRGISRRGRDDHLLRTALQVGRGLLGGGEDTSGLDNVLCTGLGPWDLGGIFLHVELDLLAVDNQGVTLDFDCALELTVCAVILQHVCGVLGLDERIVDSHNVDVIVLDAGDTR